MSSIYRDAPVDKFIVLDDKVSIDLGTVSTDERIRISGEGPIIFVKNMTEEPIRAGYSKEGFTIYVLPKDRTV